MTNDEVLRDQLLQLLRGGNAHMSLDQAVVDFPPGSMNSYPQDVSYTPWHLLEHIRLSQRDILDFIENPDYEWLPFPEGYWPKQSEQADQKRWNTTLQGIKDDLGALERIIENPDTDLYSDLPHAKGYNILREVLIVADHNAYHIGEFGILRQIMGTWPENRTG